MARHGIPDSGDQAKSANGRFLSGLPPSMAKMFQYFYKVMMGLREDVTEKEFKGVLSDYLEKLVELAEGRTPRGLKPSTREPPHRPVPRLSYEFQCFSTVRAVLVRRC